jgi:hypothetical protein
MKKWLKYVIMGGSARRSDADPWGLEPFEPIVGGLRSIGYSSTIQPKIAVFYGWRQKTIIVIVPSIQYIPRPSSLDWTTM